MLHILEPNEWARQFLTTHTFERLLMHLQRAAALLHRQLDLTTRHGMQEAMTAQALFEKRKIG